MVDPESEYGRMREQGRNVRDESGTACAKESKKKLIIRSNRKGSTQPISI